MQAVIMAGGFGTRLRPITCSVPKPMAPVANKPMLCHIINLLKQNNFDDLTMMLYYQPEIITDYFGDGKKFGVDMKYLRPESDLGTAGSVKFAQKNLTDTFMVISGDVLTDFDLSKAVEFHKKKKAIATMVLTRVNNPLQFGVVIADEEGRIERFLEKPSWGEVFSDTINTGIYILEPEVFDYIPQDKSFDFSKDLYPLLLKEKKPLYGYIAEGYWKDIGNHDEYRLAHYDVLDGKVNIGLTCRNVKLEGKELCAGNNAVIGKNVVIDSQVILGDNVVIEDGARIFRSVIGSNVRIGAGADVLGAIIWDNATIGRDARLKEVVIGNSTIIGDRAVVQVGTIIADQCKIGEDAIIRTNLRIWPHKLVEAGAILASSLVWGEKWNKALFNAYGITGLGNIEITPEFAAKIGSAYGAFVGAGAYILTSRDDHRATRMIKRGIISGLLSAGVKVGDLRSSPIPVVRYEIGNEGEAGGVHVRQSPYDPRLVDIKFFNAKGSDISINQEKAIEQLFFREDFKRANMNDVGEITVPPRAVEYYKTGYLNTIKKDKIQKSKKKIVIDYAYSSASMIFPAILGELDVDAVALNAFVNSSKITKSQEEFSNSLSRLSDIVTTLKSDVGFLIDTGAEKLFLVDEKGKIIPDDLAMLIMAYLVMKTNKNKDAVIAVPINTSSVIDELAVKFGVKIKRTAMSPRNIMAATADKDVVFVGDGMGGFIFPEFLNSFDAMYAIGKVIEIMSEEELSLSSISREIPHFDVLHKAVPCSWDKKGQAMRKAIEDAKGKKSELVDGVKIHFSNGWVLLVPDPDEAFFHVWAESKEKSAAAGFIEIYSEKIREWQE
ncbi:MAG: mannose-1-phosphate guanyltransferase [Endomicrobia bacterium]|nr:mannose-1-phosphate guanyltransferase [Endomicrobiia bacterium]MCL2506484.1 mannose-1-phosphate guanyltransferase [Endomicrobiia bacterium]